MLLLWWEDPSLRNVPRPHSTVIVSAQPAVETCQKATDWAMGGGEKRILMRKAKAMGEAIHEAQP